MTDPELLEVTGGIVQGMSGSPILQDGRLVGAVTHVLVNDPTTGYGIFIENMLDLCRIKEECLRQVHGVRLEMNISLSATHLELLEAYFLRWERTSG